VSGTLEPHAFGDASPFATRDVGAIAAVAFSIRPWIVVDSAIDVAVAEPRAVAALVGVSLAAVRVWGGG
jgi:hypothetical protein